MAIHAQWTLGFLLIVQRTYRPTQIHFHVKTDAIVQQGKQIIHPLQLYMKTKLFMFYVYVFYQSFIIKPSEFCLFVFTAKFEPLL